MYVYKKQSIAFVMLNTAYALLSLSVTLRTIFYLNGDFRFHDA